MGKKKSNDSVTYSKLVKILKIKSSALKDNIEDIFRDYVTEVHIPNWGKAQVHKVVAQTEYKTTYQVSINGSKFNYSVCKPMSEEDMKDDGLDEKIARQQSKVREQSVEESEVDTL